VNALPSSYLLPPGTGEVFISIEVCEQCLHKHSLLVGLILNKEGRFYNERVVEKLDARGLTGAEIADR
jgi:hypothetical protein